MKRRESVTRWGFGGRAARRRAFGGREALSAVAIVAVLSASQSLVAPAAVAQQPPALGLPAPLESEPPPPPRVEIPAGDSTGAPPHPAQRSSEPPAPRSSFDPARSRVLDAETTPTKLVYANPDGSRTAVLSQAPVRFKDPAGAWRDIDTSVVASGGGLAAKSAPDAATLGALAAGALATVATPAGDVVARHPDALPVPGTPTKDGATYAKALPGGRDLIVRPLVGGFTESVVLPDAKAPSSYRLELVVPAGVVVTQQGSDVELRDGSAGLVGRFGSGLAFDASFAQAGPAATAPVSTRLISQDGAVATVEVAIAPPEWLTAPQRVFPVTIDPTFSQLSSSAGALDTWVYSGEYANNPYPSHPWLVVGSGDYGAHTTRSLLRFDLSSLPTGANVTVTDAKLRLYEWYSFAGSCAARPVALYGLAAPPTAATSWNNQPAVDGAGVVSTKSFAHHDAVGSPCPGANESLDATSLARRWLTNGAANNGIQVRAVDELDPYAYKAFYSAEGSSDPNIVPMLSITYNRPPAIATAAGPADGASVPTPTPTLAANLTTDPDGDPVKYWFRATTSPDAESGAKVVDSGWLSATPANTPCAPGQICYTVPDGAFSNGGMYWWHVHTSDGAEGSYGHPDWARALRVDLHLGADPAAPTDQLAPPRSTWPRATW